MPVMVTAAAFFLFVETALAQHHPVFPGRYGQELLDSLAVAYKPVFSMPQSQARDTLFGKIYNQNDSLTCVYTGFTIWLDPTQDPTQAAFMNGGPDAINTEHTYPQSLGATGLAEGDLHHLFPTRADVNAARGNSPFTEIPDEETQEWYYLNQKTTTIPTTNIDLYSERKGDLFEPREDHKGNVARAMFYFYTMYKAQADLANPAYFESQRQTLCEWHYLDPVDGLEWQRTWHIAQYQAKPNPFVLDCTVAARSYCSDFGNFCETTGSDDLAGEVPLRSVVVPNPVRESAHFVFSLHRPGKVRLEIFNWTGSVIEMVELGHRTAGEHRYFWQKNAALPPGPAFYRIVVESGGKWDAVAGKFVMLP